jgi:hypothetical protein
MPVLVHAAQPQKLDSVRNFLNAYKLEFYPAGSAIE